ncbi:hypothetical protein LG3211_0217 [Lysobacter gummosus]|nr:hypothetical protein LG3211_0217 [Lysobacter gummosus]
MTSRRGTSRRRAYAQRRSRRPAGIRRRLRSCDGLRCLER